MPSFPVKTARELMDAEFDARWTAREAIAVAARATLGAILDRFVAAGGPIHIAALATARDLVGLDVRAAVAELDAADLVAVRDDRIVLAYPFASDRTDFVVDIGGGRNRHACCAIDALGIAPMLDRPIVVRARCHHCGEPLELPGDVDGPRAVPDAMAWVGRRDALRAKACDGL